MAHGLVRRESVETEMQKSEGSKKTFVYTKKRGYDVTRNPHLNKVSLHRQSCKVFIFVSMNGQVVKLTDDAFMCCWK